jgi:hypothetical protein
MAEEAFGDVLRDLAGRKLRWPTARRGLGAQIHRLIELQGAAIDPTLVNRWLRNETAPPLDSLYLPALRDALGLDPDEFARLYRAAAHSRGATLPLTLMRPAPGAAPASPTDESPGPSPDDAAEMPPPVKTEPIPREPRDFWPLLGTVLIAALLAVALSRCIGGQSASPGAMRGAVAPGGKWVSPGPRFVVTGDTLHFAARAYPTSPNDPPVAAVYFTVTWDAPDGGWRIACRAASVIPGTPDTYACEWPLTANVPNGEITVSFDVYDANGNYRKAPNGLQAGEVRR